jgi:hypothetical protein
MKIIPQTEIEKKRTAWWSEHSEPGMSMSEVFDLNEQLISLFPMTDEERKQKAKDMENIPEFVL